MPDGADRVNLIRMRYEKFYNAGALAMHRIDRFKTRHLKAQGFP